MPIKISNEISLWARRLALYLILGAVVILALRIAFSYFGFMHTDVDSARYMLSALVQSEAAIVALVVTLSLVAVQLAASSYSARVIEVFRRTPDLWILMGIYGAAIFYGLGVLKMIEKANPQANSLSNLEGHVAFSYYLGVFAFVALVPYIWNTLELLKPSTVINRLAERINQKNILCAIPKDWEEIGDGITLIAYSKGPRIESDPILPIIDIVRSSLMKFDFETVKEGLKAIGGRVDYILNNEIFTMDEEWRISIYIFEHLTKISKLAASRDDEVSLVEAINCMQKIGIRGAMRELPNITSYSTLYLLQIYDSLRFSQFKSAIKKVIYSLEVIGSTAANRKFKIAIEKTVTSLENVGIDAAKHNAEYTVMIIWSLERLLEIVKTQNLAKATQQIEESIKKVNEALGKSEN